MGNILGAVLEFTAAFFAASSGQGSQGQETQPLKYWGLCVAFFALFISVLAGIWTVCLSVLGKP